jgi:hypothetical protein
LGFRVHNSSRSRMYVYLCACTYACACACAYACVCACVCACGVRACVHVCVCVCALACCLRVMSWVVSSQDGGFASLGSKKRNLVKGIMAYCTDFFPDSMWKL